jgi:GDP-L-fucose synthase
VSIDLAMKRIMVTGDLEWDTTQPNGRPRRKLDTTRAKERFSFEATTGFDEGLRATIDWLEAQG